MLGTRPEAIKLAPVILAARRVGSLCVRGVTTGQHRNLVAPALAAFGLTPDRDLALMEPAQTPSGLLARCLAELGGLLADTRPAVVVVQGDTTSALAGALAAFHARIPLVHVEAGLRTGDPAAPFPEEGHRQMIARIAALHMAPTADARANLLAERIPDERIVLTGNTVVDAIRLLAPELDRIPLPLPVTRGTKILVVTAHRRENLGAPLERICDAICRLARLRRDVHVVFLRHPNPAASRIVERRLRGRHGITLLDPLPYPETLALLTRSWLVLTDSGGIQEEAPSLGLPVLVLRDQTERIESLRCGASSLVGTDPARITRRVITLLDAPGAYERMMPASNPYGDGHAAERIVAALERLLHRPAGAAAAVPELAIRS